MPHCYFCETRINRITRQSVQCNFCDLYYHQRCLLLNPEYFDDNHQCRTCKNNPILSTFNFDDSFFKCDNDYTQQFKRFQRDRRLHFLHLNAQSLTPKLEEVRKIAKTSNAAVIGVTETWLDDSIEDPGVEIEGYTIHRQDREQNGRMGGGVCMFVRNDLLFLPRPDLFRQNLETVWALIWPTNWSTDPILTGVCYRPPAKNDFYKLLKVSINEGNGRAQGFRECECIMLGDFNTDLNNMTPPSENILLNNLYEFGLEFGLHQIISKPTRVCAWKASILDLIFVSNHNNICQSGVIKICTADHYLIYCTRRGYSQNQERRELAQPPSNSANQLNTTDYTCTICGQNCKAWIGLFNHMKWKHKQTVP